MMEDDALTASASRALLEQCRAVGERAHKPTQNAASIGRVRRAFVLCLLLLACSKSEPPPPDPAMQKAADKKVLEGLIALDVKTSQALRDVDEAAVKGDAGAASGILSGRARPAADEALNATKAAKLETDWGRAKQQELTSILTDRQTEMPKYTEAVSDPDPQKMLDAIEAQASIERRALATVAAVREER